MSPTTSPLNENPTIPTQFGRKPSRDFPRDLFVTEIFWRNLQPWLESKGYMLRPRYKPDWKPSWKEGEYEWNHEDSCINAQRAVIDATRILDGEMVMLKKVLPSVHPHEVDITRYFSTEPVKSHPQNHCVPLLDMFEVPNRTGPDRMIIMVFPFLRAFQNPPMKSIGEAVEFCRQIFEGLHFMHDCHIAHRDAMDLNIMMDPRPTYPNMFHPINTRMNRNFKGRAKHFTRTARPTKYYLIDFGISRQYDPQDSSPLELPIFGGDKSVPEFIADCTKPYNPFHTDIYYVGNMIRETFLNKTCGLEFMSSLVADMTQDDPEQRPDIDEVVYRFTAILSQLHWWTLRSRLVYLDESCFKSFCREVRHWNRTVWHILFFRRALPTPPHK
ncbi:kinase-like domain-containing protein [Abortiporus biennis]|nr:kinase-like domain-containing protein [Abortiporus biennis]